MPEGVIRVEVLSWLARGMNFPREDKAVWEEPIKDGETLGDLMDRLAARYAHFSEFYDPNSRLLQDHVELVLNGRLYDLAGLDRLTGFVREQADAPHNWVKLLWGFIRSSVTSDL